MTFRSFVRPLFVALSLAFATTAAAPAFADEPATKPAPAKEEKGKKAEHAKSNEKRPKGKIRVGALEKFPMKAEQFEKVIEKRIAHIKSKVEAALKKHNTSDADKAKVMKEVDDGAVAVRAAAKKAGSDGTVTKDEAKTIRDLAKKIRDEVKAKLSQKKSPAAKDV